MEPAHPLHPEPCRRISQRQPLPLPISQRTRVIQQSARYWAGVQDHLLPRRGSEAAFKQPDRGSRLRGRCGPTLRAILISRVRYSRALPRPDCRARLSSAAHFSSRRCQRRQQSPSRSFTPGRTIKSHRSTRHLQLRWAAPILRYESSVRHRERKGRGRFHQISGSSRPPCSAFQSPPSGTHECTCRRCGFPSPRCLISAPGLSAKSFTGECMLM